MRPPAHSIELTQVTEWKSGRTRSVQDALSTEEPLEIRVNGEPLAVTMRTPGHDLELVAGFLITEGIVAAGAEIANLRSNANGAGSGNFVDADLAGDCPRPETLQRNFYAASSCGICGKSTIASIRRRGLPVLNRKLHIDPEALCALPTALASQQAVFERTGGLHAAALFDDGARLLVLREDIGRHNAVDKVVGWAHFEGRLPLAKSILLVSGRGGFEIAQKAIAAGIPLLASVSAPSSLAVKLAREMGLTLIGFLRGHRFVIYSGDFRVRGGV
jgi:FdhD protein